MEKSREYAPTAIKRLCADKAVLLPKTIRQDLKDRAHLYDAATLTSLSAGHLRAAIHTGKLKGKIIGRGYKIKRDDLNTYIHKL